MGEIKAIETVYNGYRFRSRLEARWAVFFDALGVKYEYEPEGFELPSGERYLPDFRLKCHGTRGGCYDDYSFDLYVEVKGEMTQEDADKIREFAFNGDDNPGSDYDLRHKWMNPVLIVGNIPPECEPYDGDEFESYWPMNGTNVYPFNYETIDGDYFAAYPAAHKGMFYLWGDDSNYINDEDIDLVKTAYRKARQARFEYGETPEVI